MDAAKQIARSVLDRWTPSVLFELYMHPSNTRPAIFLDRDGVINDTVFRDGKPRAPDRVEDFRFFPGVEGAIRRFHSAGYLTIVVTNQPDVARGWQTRENVDAMNQVVRNELNVTDLYVCFHVEADGCLCRKPLPGMLLDAAAKWDIDLSRSYMVGDRFGDICAGVAAGCKGSILVGPGDSQKDAPEPSARVSSLAEAADWILATGQ